MCETEIAQPAYRASSTWQLFWVGVNIFKSILVCVVCVFMCVCYVCVVCVFVACVLCVCVCCV